MEETPAESQSSAIKQEQNDKLGNETMSVEGTGGAEAGSQNVLRRGDLVRVSPKGQKATNYLRFRSNSLGRILEVTPNSEEPSGFVYTVEWMVQGGKLAGVSRDYLVYTTAKTEGMIDTGSNGRQSRKRKKPESYEEDAKKLDDKKKKYKLVSSTGVKVPQVTVKKPVTSKIKRTVLPKRSVVEKIVAKTDNAPKKPKKLTQGRSLPKASTSAATASSNALSEKKEPTVAKEKKQPPNVKRKQASTVEATAGKAPQALELYEKHRREFERMLDRLENKVDKYRCFSEEAPPEWEESLPSTKHSTDNSKEGSSAKLTHYNAEKCDETETDESDPEPANVKTTNAKSSKPSKFPQHPPYNWKMLRRRMELGRYVMDRLKREEEERFARMDGYYSTLGEKRPRRLHSGNEMPRTKLKNKKDHMNSRVRNIYGVNWEVFRDDIFGMCDAGIKRETENPDLSYSITSAANKIKDRVSEIFERTGRRQMQELDKADDTHKYLSAIESSENKEAAMQTHRESPYPERIYERLSADKVCDGLSKVDEDIAICERQTSLKDSFVGVAYRYDDTGQSEAWMKSVVNETASNGKSKDKVRQAALGLSADEGVTRAQVVATMRSLLISVQDKVMTDQAVLRQPEVRSVNWDYKHGDSEMRHLLARDTGKESSADDVPSIVEQPVWGIDCYTRRNITTCLQAEFDYETTITFVEKWLLPAINACPVEFAQTISNAARLLEGLPLLSEEDTTDDVVINTEKKQSGEQQQTILGVALQRKIESCSPPWLKAAANELRRARAALGPNFFRIHPKGHGSVLLSHQSKANRLVTYYRGELYPSWRWGEKMDAITLTQERKDLKPALPDFYNMALERPQADPRGYGLLFVDASRKAGYGSSLSHSCDPTCEVKVAAKDGELCLAMTTLRELEMGEELTFDYHAVTESLNEYKSAVCLCGYKKCRGSFLHFATADCYQQVLNRNAPIATRFSNLVKGSMKQIMSDEDERVLHNHGFNTAAFGAVSINRREEAYLRGKTSLADTMDLVPVWLKTYVADTLRYIEYERRALPISLICDHISNVKNKQKQHAQDSAATEKITPQMKEPGKEPAFFYFARMDRENLMSLLKKENPLYESMNSNELPKAIKRLASTQWQQMSDDKKEHWKERANAEYEKKKMAWLSSNNQQATTLEMEPVKDSGPHPKRQKTSKPMGGKGKFDIGDVLNSSKISFEDADSEGMSAMEQRIQQLTQSLNRVGRVLDRHREGILQTATHSDNSAGTDTLRKVIHAPVAILSDEKVIKWIWTSENGVVQSLLREVKKSPCVRPSLVDRLNQIVESKYVFLADFEGSADDSKHVESSSKGIEGRLQLQKALLEMRRIIIDELKEMARDFRRCRAARKGVVKKNGKLSGSTNVIDGNADAQSETEKNRPVPSNLIVSEGGTSHTKETHPAVDVFQADIKPSDVSSENVAQSTNELLQPDCAVSLSSSHPFPEFADAETNVEDFSHTQHYDQRWRLQAAADALLMYAYTSNFFTMRPYRDLKSTPVEVYARELGNSVSKTVIDESVKSPLGEADENGAGHNNDDTTAATKSLCSPDDIVSKVTVRYQGDFVLSQLLQWYNGGFGQKAGLPDLLGCTVLPSMTSCWSSRLASHKAKKGDKRTVYELEVRPSLISWFQDIYQRGNPWPDAVRQAFTIDKGQESNPSTNDVFGTPILDFLVIGDESNIHDVLQQLDSDDKIVTHDSSNGLLSSVDRGRPAQAVSTWVQCENPECLKWRKIPWHVDVDLLPEKFYCKDNKWNSLANSCDASEDDWDFNDSVVDAEGKVEGSPVRRRKRPDGAASPLDEKSFTCGARFDVLREGKGKFCVGIVSKIDFSGKVKRVQFHFPKTSSKHDEWVEFGSDRIARLHTKVPREVPFKKPTAVVPGPDRPDEASFQVGARFSVRRNGHKKYQEATVADIACAAEDRKKILFHFRNRPVEDDEWIDMDSQRITKWTGKGKNGKSEGVDAKDGPKTKPLKPGDFAEGVRFNVLYGSPETLQPAIVCGTDFSEGNQRVFFEFQHVEPKAKEWIEIDSDRISRTKPKKIKPLKPLGPMKARRPSLVDVDTMQVGDVFDVLRGGMQRFSMGVVQKLDYSEEQTRIEFSFPKAQPKSSEWVVFDKDRIKPYSPRPRYKPRDRMKKSDSPDDDRGEKEDESNSAAVEEIENTDVVQAPANLPSGLDLLLSVIDGECSKGANTKLPESEVAESGDRIVKNIDNQRCGTGQDHRLPVSDPNLVVQALAGLQSPRQDMATHAPTTDAARLRNITGRQSEQQMATHAQPSDSSGFSSLSQFLNPATGRQLHDADRRMEEIGAIRNAQSMGGAGFHPSSPHLANPLFHSAQSNSFSFPSNVQFGLQRSNMMPQNAPNGFPANSFLSMLSSNQGNQAMNLQFPLNLQNQNGQYSRANNFNQFNWPNPQGPR